MPSPSLPEDPAAPPGSRLLPEPEPAFEELPPSPAPRLDVPAVLQTDLARVRLSGAAVSFSDTFMFQVRRAGGRGGLELRRVETVVGKTLSE